METAAVNASTKVVETQAAFPTITSLPQTETSLVTITNTAFYTPVPTFITLTPSKFPTIAPPTLEPVPFTSFRIIMTVNKTGENITPILMILSAFLPVLPVKLIISLRWPGNYRISLHKK
jgi:hypothetical protein